MDKELFIFPNPVKGIKVVDQNHLNNGGHNEYIIFKIKGHKSAEHKYCVIEHDIYGKAESNIMTKDEVIKEFGKDVMFNWI